MVRPTLGYLTCPWCEQRPSARSLAALSAVISGLLCHRHRGPAFRGRRRDRPAFASSHSLAAASAHAIAVVPLAAGPGSRSGWCDVERIGVVPAHAETVQVAWRWVEFTWVVCNRLGVGCKLVCALGRAPDRMPEIGAPIVPAVENRER